MIKVRFTLNQRRTPVDTLNIARVIALEEELHNTYISNIPNFDAQNTICPKCGKVVVERKGYFILQNNIESSKCKFCSAKSRACGIITKLRHNIRI